ncbi:DUF4112 domain-containing protein [Halomarina oriensis]|uniref:DUF4112 domain-containing protein n=1 Tax=Halomarina oriensis TaxID=671145 RepID=A0A6B0GNM9_9EURY|nr:DUF4112 domain-containing protein [Halomarina oriensis]MWG36412.1 DUF4112 domain-containing protein [Halomarina oriensis]
MALTDADETLERCQFLANLLDDAVPIPGTDQRIGLDSILGVLPVAGDAVTAVASSYIVLEAARLGAPKRTVARMTANVVVDFLFGSVPLLGDLFDMFFKASRRNVELLEDYLDADGEEAADDAEASADDGDESGDETTADDEATNIDIAD